MRVPRSNYKRQSLALIERQGQLAGIHQARKSPNVLAITAEIGEHWRSILDACSLRGPRTFGRFEGFPDQLDLHTLN